MPSSFNDLVKIYIQNLDIPQDKKDTLLASNPKTLADISLWLKKNENNSNVETSKNQLINLFTKKDNDIDSSIKLNTKTTLVNTDDASWGLSVEKTQSTNKITLYSNTSSQNTNTKTQVEQAKTQEPAIIEAQNNAIASIRENVNTAIENVMQQTDNQGNISKKYNSIKEYFQHEMALSSVCRNIYIEDVSANLLEKAQSGTLTVEEYYKAKINAVIDMLAGGKELTNEEKACLEAKIATLTPEELNQLIDKIKTANNEEYAKLNQNLDKLVNEGRQILQSQGTDNSTTSFNANPNSILALLKSGKGKEIMTFNQVYKMERGVEFSPDAIKLYDNAATEFTMALIVSNKAESIHELLDSSLAIVKGNNANGADANTTNIANKNLETNILEALKTLYNDNEEKINEELQKLSNGSISYKNGQLIYDEYSQRQKGYSLASVAEKLLANVDKNKQKVLKGRTLEDFQNTMQSHYEFAYGRKNATQLAKAYQNDQENIVKKVRSGVEYTGAGIMIAGMFIYPPAALAGALASSFGGTAIEAYNESTRKNGIDAQTKQKLTEEIMQNAALFAVGGVASKMSSVAKAALLAKNCPTFMACISDIGLDATISLIGDMAITGEIDLAGEGFSQVMSILAGHLRAKKFGKNAISRQDLNPTKNPIGNHALEHLKKTDPKLYEDYQLLRSKNMLPENFAQLLYNPENTRLNDNLKKDIQLMATCVRNGIDPKDAFIPKIKNLEEATKTKKAGEVFSLEGTNDLYIMDGSTPVKLDMDRDMYYALFPPIQSHCTSQGSLGDCYFVSAILDGSMNNPKAKVELLKMFHQKGNDIIFEISNYGQGEYSKIFDNLPSKITFKDAKKNIGTNNTIISGAMGLKIAEQAYGYKLAAEKIISYLDRIDAPQETIDKVCAELKKIFDNPSYKPSEELNQIIKDCLKDENKKINSKDNPFDALRKYCIGNGGSQTKTLNDFFNLHHNCTKVIHWQTTQDMVEKLENLQISENSIITAGTNNLSKLSEKALEKFQMLFGVGDRGKIKVHSQHAYRIVGYNTKEKTISIVNPWDTSKVVKLTFEQYQKFFGNDFAITDISKKAKSELPESVQKIANKHNIPTKTKNGRFYTEEEFIEKYLDKLEKEKNISRPKLEKNTMTGMNNPDFVNNPSIQNLLEKMKKLKVSGFELSNTINTIYDNCGFDQKKIDAAVKSIEKLYSENKNNYLSYLIISIKHPDYEFMLEKAVELVPLLKAKGYSNDLIVSIIHNLTRENYNEMKKLWE